jgi:sulfur carrier protein
LLIKILLNGEEKELMEGWTVAQLVHSLQLPAQRIAIEYNRRILKKEKWATHPIEDGDRIEIVHFVGGG